MINNKPGMFDGVEDSHEEDTPEECTPRFLAQRNRQEASTRPILRELLLVLQRMDEWDDEKDTEPERLRAMELLDELRLRLWSMGENSVIRGVLEACEEVVANTVKKNVT